MENVLQFLYGGLVLMCGVVGVFFLRYWYIQRDRFFLWFMVAFWALGVGWGLHLVYSGSETGPYVYAVRLVAFLLIIAGIVDKNRRAKA